MKRFIEGTDRGQSTLFPAYLEDWIDEDNPVRVIDVFVEELDLSELEFSGVEPEVTGRPSYHPSVLLKLYIYGYLNRVQSSRRLEREALRNVETILKAAGSSLDRVVKVTVLLARGDLYKEMNEAYAEFFPGAKPARAMVRFGADIPGVLVAIEAVALA